MARRKNGVSTGVDIAGSETQDVVVDKQSTGDIAPSVVVDEVSTSPDLAVDAIEKRTRISGEELAGRLRQERHEKRLKEKGY